MSDLENEVIEEWYDPDFPYPHLDPEEINL